jgi:3-hydroxymyristoyl/3-hydroxydecanoyl-(acyl carrier protein) dehydratase
MSPAQLPLDRLMRQRAPFRFIDKVVSAEPDRIVCHKAIAADEYYFKGHFPEAPVVPGVLIVEMAAQACQILAAMGSAHESEAPPMGMLAKVGEFTFYGPAKPGDELAIEVTFGERRGAYQESKAVIRNLATGKRVARGQVVVFVPQATATVRSLPMTLPNAIGALPVAR